MLEENEIQALYEEVRPDSVDTFSYTGEQLHAIIPALKRMKIFEDIELEVLEAPFVFSVGKLVDDERVHTIKLGNSFVPNKKCKIYSVMFMPGVFKEHLQPMPHGTYMLPPTTSEVDFKMKRSILTKIDPELIHEARWRSEAIIQPEGRMINGWDKKEERVRELKADLLRDFSLKLDRIFSMEFEDFRDAGISDVHRFGMVFIRISPDSYTIDHEAAHFDDYSYFRVIESIGALPF